jgi:hypothetical protein
MIPRKRLQVLLHILQIFYVFGDGDPGSEGLLVSEVPDNVIDNPVFTTKPPRTDHFIHESITSMEKDKISNISENSYNSNYAPKDDESLDTQEYATIAPDFGLRFSSGNSI